MDGTTIFCDDIREEVSGKSTLVGVYKGVMLLHTRELPVTLPKLCFFIIYPEPPDPSYDKLELKIFAPGEKEPVCTADVAMNKARLAVPLPMPEIGGDPNFHQLSLAIILSPFKISEFGRINVRAYRDEEELKLGSLLVEPLAVPPEADEAAG